MRVRESPIFHCCPYLSVQASVAPCLVDVPVAGFYQPLLSIYLMLDISSHTLIGTGVCLGRELVDTLTEYFVYLRVLLSRPGPKSRSKIL